MVLRLLGRRATSFPGHLALRVSPRLMRRLGRQLRSCVVVTGTNGKTTTSVMLATIFRSRGPCVNNASGANLRQGLMNALISAADWRGRLRMDRAVFEVDEATLPLVARDLPIDYVAVTNVFRDQLDRYGEIDTALQLIVDGIRRTRATAVLNADDPLARYIGLRCGRPTVYYGMSRQSARPPDREQTRDGESCLRCGHRLRYDGYFYGQLGLYWCGHCNFARPPLDFTGHYDGKSLHVVEGRAGAASFDLPVRGLFNAYNALCAIAVARLNGFRTEEITAALRRYRGPIGRMQVFPTEPVAILSLIKNPTGCDSILQAICREPGPKVLCVAINDRAADGRDVSWLWDADWELVPERGGVLRCVTTGTRAEDMAVRLKYAGYPTRQIETTPDLEEGIRRALRAARTLGSLPVYVLTTYTALYGAARVLEQLSERESRSPDHP
ncbi:MAG: DUF1727 domain-containing protein [Clostridia bacterium]|nr:DUF1727 domain-containing protein [Clostridia bacterium]